METTIRCHNYKGSGQDVFSPLEEGPSYLRLICNVTVHYALRRLGGGDLAEPVCGKPSWTRASESEHIVDDPSDFLDYERTRRIACRLFTRLRGLHDLDVSPKNWFPFVPGDMALNILETVRANENKGLCGGRYRFTESMDVEVTLVFSEPKAVLHYCVENVMPTLDPATCGDSCGICLDGLTSLCETPLVNLPCGHPFHSECIFKWLFKGTSCPLCRHDLRGLAAAADR
ncbi:unnamed protein product [Urochloa humidicola]